MNVTLEGGLDSSVARPSALTIFINNSYDDVVGILQMA